MMRHNNLSALLSIECATDCRQLLQIALEEITIRNRNQQKPIPTLSK